VGEIEREIDTLKKKYEALREICNNQADLIKLFKD